jgi:hypothetical protein
MKRALSVFALLVAVVPARADVTIESRLTIESVAGTGSGSVRTETSGLRRREERRLALDGTFASAQPETSQTSIIRLDRAVVDHLYAADSTYEEVPLARVLARAARGTAVPGFDGGSSLELTWTVTSESPTGEATIAGFTAKPTAITVRGKGSNKETGQPIEVALTLELWMAGGLPGAAELRAFDAKYAAAVGLAPGVIEESMASFGVPKAAARQLTAARAKVAGTPLRTVMRVSVPSLSDLMAKLSRSMGGALGGAAPAADGPLLTTTLEVERIGSAPIAPARFRVPAGWHKRLSAASDR